MRYTNHSSPSPNLKSQKWDFDYVACSKEELFSKFHTKESGLSEQDAKKRLEEYGHNEPTKQKKKHILIRFFSRFLNPLVIVLLTIAVFSFFLDQISSTIIVSCMAFLSVMLGFVQEEKANKAAEKLKLMVHVTATVVRSGKVREVHLNELVPGDIVDLSSGDMVPADVRILSCKDLYVNQAALTGESFPIEKDATPSSPMETKNLAFMGSSVVSGAAFALVIKTGPYTQFGALYQKLESIVTETSFDRGVRGFTMLMVRAMICMVFIIFGIVAIRNREWMEALLFSLGVAVGLTPEMLPMIVTVTLANGALILSKKEVIVKRLSSIQNFGAMDILCTDKTGTLTLDKIILEKHCDVNGREDEDVLRYAYINSFYQTGLKNILDKAILNHEKLLVKQFTKIDEIPFDFVRRIMSVIVQMNGSHSLIAKGAPEEVFQRCTHYELDGKILPINPEIVAEVEKEYTILSQEGFRVLAIAYKHFEATKTVYSKEDERGLVLKGYVAFLDPPKPTAKKAIEGLKHLGISVKVLTGDNDLVTKKICSQVGLDASTIVTGNQVEEASESELRDLVEKAQIFARLLPLQKDRVIRALHANGHIVGYLGDGINDAPALKISDVGISVNNAVDIAKESADLILLKKSLRVLEDAVHEGRKTFGNIVKYIKMGSSSNFGNMVSMTGASLFLPFLPMLPIQIIFNNFLYDLSQIAIPSDNVDPEYLKKPRPWNINAIKKFMLLVGPISSIFDFITFGVLLFIFNANATFFHTAWFMESIVTQTLVIHIIRTTKIPFIESFPSKFLLLTSIVIVLFGILLPYSPWGVHFGFMPLPASFFVALFLIVSGYLFLVQKMKGFLIRKYGID